MINKINMTNIEKNVMRRVHTIHVFRPFVSGSAFSIVVAAFALYGIGREVWVARVFENAPHDFARVPEFYFSAFTNTEIIVQILTVITLISMIYLARKTAKLISNVLVPA
jgi:nicotinamide mononucleotide adenylyltransferase